MANYVCPQCNGEVSAFMPRCPHCGAELQVQELPKKRAIIVSIYLWFATVINGLLTTLYFICMFTDKGAWSAYEPMSQRVTEFVISAVTLTGFIMLLSWKRLGLIILSIVVIINTITALLNDVGPVFTIGPAAGWLLLMLMLKIKKDGVSCMNHLD